MVHHSPRISIQPGHQVAGAVDYFDTAGTSAVEEDDEEEAEEGDDEDDNKDEGEEEEDADDDDDEEDEDEHDDDDDDDDEEEEAANIAARYILQSRMGLVLELTWAELQVRRQALNGLVATRISCNI